VIANGAPSVTALPTGTVTFLFTDIEGSTRLVQEFGTGYAELPADHCRIIRDAIRGGASPPPLSRSVPRPPGHGAGEAATRYTAGLRG
jgi:hypothetical protein